LDSHRSRLPPGPRLSVVGARGEGPGCGRDQLRLSSAPISRRSCPN